MLDHIIWREEVVEILCPSDTNLCVSCCGFGSHNSVNYRYYFLVGMRGIIVSLRLPKLISGTNFPRSDTC